MDPRDEIVHLGGRELVPKTSDLILRGLELVQGSGTAAARPVKDPEAVRQVRMMISRIDSALQVPNDKISQLVDIQIGTTGYSDRKYHQQVAAIFSEFALGLDGPASFWVDRDYVENSKPLLGEDSRGVVQYAKAISAMSLGELKTMLTAIWRGERFADGALESALVDGVMKDIRDRLEALVGTP